MREGAHRLLGRGVVGHAGVLEDAPRASATAASPSQQAMTRPAALRTIGAQARAMSSLRTIAVGACMNSTAPLRGSASSACSVSA